MEMLCCRFINIKNERISELFFSIYKAITKESSEKIKYKSSVSKVQLILKSDYK